MMLTDVFSWMHDFVCFLLKIIFLLGYDISDGIKTAEKKQ